MSSLVDKELPVGTLSHEVAWFDVMFH